MVSYAYINFIGRFVDSCVPFKRYWDLPSITSIKLITETSTKLSLELCCPCAYAAHDHVDCDGADHQCGDAACNFNVSIHQGFALW